MAPGTNIFMQPGSSFATALNTHGNCRHVIVQGARIYGGIDLRGSGHVIKNCYIINGPTNVGAIELSEMGPSLEMEIVANTFHIFNPHFEGGTIMSGKDSEFTIDSDAIPSHLIFNDNTVYIRNAAAGAGPLFRLEDTLTKNTNIGYFEFCRNKFIFTVTPTSIPAWFGMSFKANFIRVQDNFATHGILGAWNTGFTHSFKSGNFVNGSEI